MQNQVLPGLQPALQQVAFPQNQVPGTCIRSLLRNCGVQRFSLVLIYQQPYGQPQQQLLQQMQPLQQVQQQQQQPQQIVNTGLTNPAANVEENIETNAPSTSENREQF